MNAFSLLFYHGHRPFSRNLHIGRIYKAEASSDLKQLACYNLFACTNAVLRQIRPSSTKAGRT